MLINGWKPIIFGDGTDENRINNKYPDACYYKFKQLLFKLKASNCNQDIYDHYYGIYKTLNRKKYGENLVDCSYLFSFGLLLLFLDYNVGFRLKNIYKNLHLCSRYKLFCFYCGSRMGVKSNALVKPVRQTISRTRRV